MVKTLSTLAAATLSLSTLSSLVHAHAHEGVGFHIPHAEKRENEVYLANLRARFGEAPARVVNAHLERRQGVAATTTAAAGGAMTTAAGTSTGAAAAATTMNSTVTMGSIPIGITTTPETTSPLPTTYVAGASAPVDGAPALPAGEYLFYLPFITSSIHPCGSWPSPPRLSRLDAVRPPFFTRRIASATVLEDMLQAVLCYGLLSTLSSSFATFSYPLYTTLPC